MASYGGARCAGGTAHLPTAVPSAMAPAANPSLAHAPPLPPCCPSRAAGDELRSCARLGALLLAAGARPISGMLRPADRAALRDGQTIVGPRTGTYLRVLALGVTDADLAPLWLFDTATGGMARVLGAALDGGSSSARSRSQVASSAQLRALMGARLG